MSRIPSPVCVGSNDKIGLRGCLQKAAVRRLGEMSERARPVTKWVCICITDLLIKKNHSSVPLPSGPIRWHPMARHWTMAHRLRRADVKSD